MLVGTFERSIDNKGRIMIPSKFRGNFTNSIFLYPGFEPNTIYAASEEEIHNMMGSVPNPNLLNEKFRKLSQMIYGSGQLVDIDDQGRIQINIQILEQFGIKDKVVISINVALVALIMIIIYFIDDFICS